LSIYRNDLMQDEKSNFMSQIEFNTIACATAFHDIVNKFQRVFSKKYPELYAGIDVKNIPDEGEFLYDKISESIFTAVSTEFPETYKDCVIIFVGQDFESFIFDQFNIIEALEKTYGLQSVRLNFNQIYDTCTNDEATGDLYHKKRRVSLVYYRSGYDELHYPDENCWKAREMLDLSNAIKTPNINTHLCTTKVFQYYLTKQENVMKYLKDEVIVKDLMRFNAEMYYLGDIKDEDERETVITQLKINPDNWVVKPMKEGGGHNFNSEKILEIADTDEINDVLIMRKIQHPKNIPSTFLKGEKLFSIDSTIHELGIFGTIIATDDKIEVNKVYGSYTKAKSYMSSEISITMGIGVMTIPLLVDN